jgi:SAM-dependent methyltransferase
MRAMIHALSVALFGESIALPDFPMNKGIRGLGMSDWDGYAVPLSEKLNYTNTFYHKEPRLDIHDVAPRDFQMLDFLLSSDVFEHVAPPVSHAFDNARALIKPGGVLILSVPYALEGPTVENFPDLHDFTIEVRSGERVLVNRTKEGSIEEFRDLVFHGGEGDTLEMRLFSKPDLISNLEQAGFQSVQIVSEPCYEHGIVFLHPWSLPVIAR